MRKLGSVTGLLVAVGTVILSSAGCPAQEPLPTLPEGVQTRVTEAGSYVTTADGLALYTNDNDREMPLSSSCNARCAQIWPPLEVPSGAQPIGQWVPIEREDGSLQWSYQGLPVYRFSRDSVAGVANGDGLERAWRAIFFPTRLPNGLSLRSTLEGRVLTTSLGEPVYTRDDEAGGTVKCLKECQRKWIPVAAPWIAHGSGRWAIISRPDDDTRQWAYRGRPLYVRASSEETAGSSEDTKWQHVVLEPVPEAPAWLRVHVSDMGPVYTDAKERTLYRLFTGDLQRIKRQTCDDDCIEKNWLPVLAGPTDKSVGFWSIVSGEGSKRQWAYRGGLVFTFGQDARPGDTGGEKFAGMNSPWEPILQVSTVPGS